MKCNAEVNCEGMIIRDKKTSEAVVIANFIVPGAVFLLPGIEVEFDLPETAVAFEAVSGRELKRLYKELQSRLDQFCSEGNVRDNGFKPPGRKRSEFRFKIDPGVSREAAMAAIARTGRKVLPLMALGQVMHDQFLLWPLKSMTSIEVVL